MYQYVPFGICYSHFCILHKSRYGNQSVKFGPYWIRVDVNVVQIFFTFGGIALIDEHSIRSGNVHFSVVGIDSNAVDSVGSEWTVVGGEMVNCFLSVI